MKVLPPSLECLSHNSSVLQQKHTLRSTVDLGNYVFSFGYGFR